VNLQGCAVNLKGCAVNFKGCAVNLYNNTYITDKKDNSYQQEKAATPYFQDTTEVRVIGCQPALFEIFAKHL
jgi:hypothetical protein